MKKVLVVFLLAVLFSGIVFSQQNYEWNNIVLVEDGGEVLGWMGIFMNNFVIEEDGTIYVAVRFYSYDRRSSCLLVISILQKDKETITLKWSEKLLVTVYSPEGYEFPDGIDKEGSVVFFYLFPKAINFYEPFTIKYETVFDTTWHTYDITKTQPAEREYWRRNKRS